MEELLKAMCPQCAAAVDGVLKAVQQAAAKEAVKRHEANRLAAEERLKADGETEAVLKGKR